MFIAASFIIAKTLKQARCPLIDEWFKQNKTELRPYNGILFSDENRWAVEPCKDIEEA